MGWRPEEGYYETHTAGEKTGVSYKIANLQRAMNKLGQEQTAEAMALVAKQQAKENGKVMQETTRSVDEPIEYVVEVSEKGEELDR